jgi:DNA-3-methyladenine glycosylase II
VSVAVLAKADPVLGEWLAKLGPFEHERERRTPYQALVKAVVYQQLTAKAAATIFGRVTALFPGQRFPRPEDLLAATDETLRGAGLSRAKVAAVKAIARGALDGVVPTPRQVARLTDEELVERLTSLRGVGRWTVEMLLIFTLGREDVLPATDYGVRKGFALAYGLPELPTPKELLAHGERWRPHRSLAALCLWRTLDTSRATPAPAQETSKKKTKSKKKARPQ